MNLPVPDPTPALWLLADDVSFHAPDAPVLTWPDRSIYGRDAVNLDPGSAPTWDPTSFTAGAVDFLATQSLQLLSSFLLGIDGAVFAVGQYNLASAINSFAFCPPSLSVLAGPFCWLPGQLRVKGFISTGSVPIAPDPVNALHLFVARLVSGVCHLRIDGVEKGQIALDPATTFPVAYPCLNRSANPVASQLGLVELRVYDQPLSDSSFAALEFGLRARYGL